jgi:hypothetical protein
MTLDEITTGLILCAESDRIRRAEEERAKRKRGGNG